MRIVSLVAVLTLACSFLHAETPGLKRELERSYAAWRNALVAQDFAGWQQTTAAHRQMAIRTLIVSQKQAFPHALFSLPMRPPETATLRYLAISERGNTAQLAYFGKVDIGVADASEIPESLLFLKFVRESTGWKFDTTRMVSLASTPEISAALKNGGGPTFMDAPEFALSGEVPAIAKPCPMPDRIGVLQIGSFGYTTKATVNGFDVATVQDNAEEHLVIGGLYNGNNKLELMVKQTTIPADAERSLEIHALVLTGNQEKPTYRVFSWKAEVHPVPEQVKLNIVANKSTMRD